MLYQLNQANNSISVSLNWVNLKKNAKNLGRDARNATFKNKMIQSWKRVVSFVFFYVIFSIYVTMYHRVKAFIEFTFSLILCLYLIITIILPTVFLLIFVREISELEKRLWIHVKGNSVLFIKKQNKTNTNINYFCDRFRNKNKFKRTVKLLIDHRIVCKYA